MPVVIVKSLHIPDMYLQDRWVHIQGFVASSQHVNLTKTTKSVSICRQKLH